MNITQSLRNLRFFAMALALVVSVGASTEIFAQRNHGTYLISTDDTVMGIAPGQTLRLTFYNPTADTVAGPHVRVFDGAGTLLLSYDHTPIESRRFDSFDIPYPALGLMFGEIGSGRRQVRVTTSIVFTGLESDANLFRPTWELIDTQSGQSILIGMLLPAVQKVR